MTEPPPAVELRSLTKVYDGRRDRVVAVDGVSLRVARGEVVGLLGPNGAGKTTAIKCICTLLRPTSGTIRVDGIDVLERPRHALSRIAAVLEGNRNIYWRLSPRENLEFFAGLQGIATRRVRPVIDELIEQFGLGGKRNVSARKLSRGMQQKLAVACALVKQTGILLLDEPTLGLDVETSHELRRAIKHLVGAGDRTVLLSSHDMNVVQDVCDRVIIINQGRVVTDDRVQNLLDLFRARAYRFRLEGPLTDRQTAALRERFDLIHVRQTDGRAEIEIELVRNELLYDLMDILRAGGSVIERIDREEPNLEEIFLAVLEKHR